MPRHIVKFGKLKTKKTTWKQQERKYILLIGKKKNKPTRIQRFLMRNHRAQKDTAHFSRAESKEISNQNVIIYKVIIQKQIEIKILSNEGKLRECATSRPTSKEGLKKIL